MKILALFIFFLFISINSFTQKKINYINDKVLINANKYFADCRVNGVIVIYDIKNKNMYISDSLEAESPTLPASTFKIINLLIALETKVINSEQDVVKWVGHTDTSRYGYRPEIYHDMTVKEAFELSAGWVFIELAKKIGRDNYKKYLKACDYGNLNLTQPDTDFWNFGKFAISPKSMVEFLTRLYKYDLPFSSKNIDIVKNVMLSEKTNDYKIRAKTGWTREFNTNTGWWCGFVETKEGNYVFATRLIQDRKNNRPDFGNCRKEITKSVFRELKIIK